MSEVNIYMLEPYELINLYEPEHETPSESTAAHASKQSPFPSVEDVLVDLEEAFDLRGLVA